MIPIQTMFVKRKKSSYKVKYKKPFHRFKKLFVNYKKSNNYNYYPCVQLRVSYRFNTANSKYKGTGAGQDAKNRM